MVLRGEGPSLGDGEERASDRVISEWEGPGTGQESKGGQGGKSKSPQVIRGVAKIDGMPTLGRSNQISGMPRFASNATPQHACASLVLDLK